MDVTPSSCLFWYLYGVHRIKYFNLRNFVKPMPTFMSAIVLILCGTSIRTYAFADDFSLLWDSVVNSGEEMFYHFIKEGRYLGVITHVIFFSFLETIESLAVLRLISILGWVFFCLYLCRFIGKINPKLNSVYLCVVISLLLPAFWQSISFAVLWPMSWLFCLGLKSYLLMQQKKKIRKTFGFLLLVFLSFSSIQYVFLPILFVGLKAITLKQENLKVAKEFIRSTFAISCAVVVNFILVLIIKTIFPSDFGRLGVIRVADLPEKVLWFLSRPTVVIFRPFLIDSPTPLEAVPWLAMFLSIFIASVYLSSPDSEHKVIRVLIFIIITVFPSAYLLIWNQNQIEFRLVVISSFSAVMFPLIGIQVYISNKINENLLQKSMRFVFSLVIVILMSIGLLRFDFLRMEPFLAKQNFVKAALERCSKSQVENSIIIKLPMEFPKRSLLGDYSVGTDLEMPWVPISNIGLLTKQVYPEIEVKNLKFREVISLTKDDFKQEYCEIDLSLFVSNNLLMLKKHHL